MDSRIWAKARRRALGQMGASEDDEDEEEDEDEVEGLLLGLVDFLGFTLEARLWRGGEGLATPDGPASGLLSRL
jgi:hypothetical protein